MEAQPAKSFDPGLTQSFAGTLRRIVNKDGTFNVRRTGGRLRNFHLYKFLIGLSWPWFVAIVLGTFIVANIAFAGLYLAAGIQTLQGAEGVTGLGTFLNAFFFSVQTLTTVGYGSMVPRAIGSNVIASVEALVHPIDEASPLHGKTAQDLADRAVEIMVLIRGFDDTFSQVVNARSSYRFDEILWEHRFLPAFRSDESGRLVLDLARIDAAEKTSTG